MAHKEWCGNPCAYCTNHCQLDESMPCSPGCELLKEDGSVEIHICQSVGCDAIDIKTVYEVDLYE